MCSLNASHLERGRCQQKKDENGHRAGTDFSYRLEGLYNSLDLFIP